MNAESLFEAHRPDLLAVAYRMLGSIADAEDVVQDTFERWLRLDDGQTAAIQNPAAYLTTMTTRKALDRLGSAYKRRETYPGPWLAEPMRTEDDPARIIELGEAATLGFLHLLDVLSPVERAVHLLHEAFDFSYAEVAAMVEKTEPNCRQIARRARQRLAAEQHVRWSPPSLGDEAAAITAFLEAVLAGDVVAATAILTPDAVGLSDGGPKQRAARRPISGPDRLARFFISLGSRIPPATEESVTTIDMVRVNNQPAVYIKVNGAPFSLAVFQVRPEGIDRIFVVVNPDKLAAFDRTIEADGSAERAPTDG